MPSTIHLPAFRVKGHRRLTYVVYTANCLLVVLALAFATAFYTVGLKLSLTVYDRKHAEEDRPGPLDYRIPDREWRRSSVDYVLMLLWQSWALLFTYPSIFLLQRDAPRVKPKWTLLALLLLGTWGLGVSLNSAIQNGRSFFSCSMPYPELETGQMCLLARGTMLTAWISTVSHFLTAFYVFWTQIRDHVEDKQEWRDSRHGGGSVIEYPDINALPKLS